jgi:hypothetical protein
MWELAGQRNGAVDVSSSRLNVGILPALPVSRLCHNRVIFISPKLFETVTKIIRSLSHRACCRQALSACSRRNGIVNSINIADHRRSCLYSSWELRQLVPHTSSYDPLHLFSQLMYQARQGVYQVQEYQTARQTKAVLRWEYPEGGFNGMMTRHEAAAVIGIE